MEFEARFASEEDCRQYLFRLRWPDGFRCPSCGCGKSWPLRKVLLQCATCGAPNLADRRDDLSGYAQPFAVVVSCDVVGNHPKDRSQRFGTSKSVGAEQLRNGLDVAAQNAPRDGAAGAGYAGRRVEVDESCLGGLEEGLRGRKLENKALIAVAAQEDGRGIGRIRMKRIGDASGESLLPFVKECIEPASVVHTDGWPGYSGLEKEGYVHEITVISGQEKSASELMPRVHRVVSLLKRWLLGTHQGAVSHKHLDYYLDEFSFRFNRRKSRSRGKLFYRLAQQAVAVDPATYKMIVHPVHESKQIP